jgi:hypothetical protein
MAEDPSMHVPSTVDVLEIALLRAALEDISKGRWNTGSRVLDTKGHLTANEYAQAALREANTLRRVSS